MQHRLPDRDVSVAVARAHPGERMKTLDGQDRQLDPEMLMITDTAPFRYPHYHEATDTPDKLDYEWMARVVAGVGRVVGGLVK